MEGIILFLAIYPNLANAHVPSDALASVGCHQRPLTEDFLFHMG